MAKKLTPWEKEWAALRKQETAWLNRNREPQKNRLNSLLEDKIPPKLQDTLDTAFRKAFELVFARGTPLLERTLPIEELDKQSQVDRFAAQVHGNRKSLNTFSKRSARAGRLNLALSGVEGTVLGALGVGLPDIPLFTGLMLRSLYETACQFGFPYDSPGERYFHLLLIEGAMSGGKELEVCWLNLKRYIQNPILPTDYDQKLQVERTAKALSQQLLCTKFLQGIPLVGVAGGAWDAVCLHRVQKFARLNYQRRWLLSCKPEKTADIP